MATAFIAIIAATMLLAHLLRRSPYLFLLGLLALGPFRGGSPGGRPISILGFDDLSPLWLAILMLLTGTALLRVWPSRPLRLSFPEKAYAMFLGWCLCMLLIGTTTGYGIRMLMKLSYPFLVLLLARRVLCALPQFVRAVRLILLSTALTSLAVGGIPQTLFPALTWGIGGLLWAGAGYSDYLGLMSILSVAAWSLLCDKRYVPMSVYLWLSLVLMGNRTGILAAAVGTIGYIALRTNVLLATIGAVLIYLVAIVGLLLMPGAADHMFGAHTTIDPTAVATNPVNVKLEDINGSGRFYIWPMLMDDLFYHSPLTGSGLGSAQSYLYGPQNATGIRQTHSGYVELLCDTGIVGVLLYVGAYLACVIDVIRKARGSGNTKYVVSGHMTAGLALGTLVIMGFDATSVCGTAVLQYVPGIAGGLRGVMEGDIEQ